jgi:hypothetical protein
MPVGELTGGIPMRLRIGALAVFAGVIGIAPMCFGQDNTTTTVTATGGVDGDVSVYVDTTDNGPDFCYPSGFTETSYSASVGDQTALPSSTGEIGIGIFGPGTYPVSGSYSGFTGGYDANGYPCNQTDRVATLASQYQAPKLLPLQLQGRRFPSMRGSKSP